MRWAFALLLLVPALAGCVLPGGSQDGDDGGDDANPAIRSPSQGNSTTSKTGPKPIGSNGTSATPSPQPNGTQAGASASFERVWPDPAQATIRPGASLDNGGCTANFVFTSLDNQTLYLGTAAHCFSNDLNTQTDGCLANVQALGTKRTISGAGSPGVLVYSSWSAMQAAGESGSLCDNNDFALLQIAEEDEALVSPAMWEYGGPTGLATASDLGIGQRILSYGNSGTRPQDSPLSPREGVVTLPAEGCGTRVTFPNPAIPGDSGSPVILASGAAVGDFVSIELYPVTGQGHVCLLEEMLEYASEQGFEVRLATWELLDDGLP